MKRLSKLFKLNPIVVKEVRSRMRGPRAFITLTAILVLMGLIMYGLLQVILATARYSTVLSPQIGQMLFSTLAFLELFMIVVITPAVTAGAISSEKEKETYEMLMATPLSPSSILLGKLVSALSYVLLLLFAGIPLASIVFIFGGVAPSEMLRALMVLVVIAVSYGMIGLFFSALLGRTGRATVASLITAVAFMFGPLFVAGTIGILRGSEPPRWLLTPSPISALSAALASTMSPQAGGSLFYILGGIFNIGVSPISQTSIPRPLYHYTIPFYALLSLILYLLATRLVRPTMRWRINRKDWVIGLGSVLLVVAAIAGAYFASAGRYEWAITQQTGLSIDRGMAMPVPAAVAPAPRQVVVQAQAETATPTPALTETAENGGQALTPPGATPPVEEFDESTQAEIYAALVRQMYTVDHTFGDSPPNWPEVYLISVTDDNIGDPNGPKGGQVELSAAIRDSVAERLSDLPIEKLEWIEFQNQAPFDPSTGMVSGGKGVVMTFGNIHPHEDGGVRVAASLFFANLGAAGKTYVLEQVDGEWGVTGTTGVEWIS